MCWCLSSDVSHSMLLHAPTWRMRIGWVSSTRTRNSRWRVPWMNLSSARALQNVRAPVWGRQECHAVVLPAVMCRGSAVKGDSVTWQWMHVLNPRRSLFYILASRKLGAALMSVYVQAECVYCTVVSLEQDGGNCAPAGYNSRPHRAQSSRTL